MNKEIGFALKSQQVPYSIGIEYILKRNIQFTGVGILTIMASSSSARQTSIGYTIPRSGDIPKSPLQTSSQLFATLPVINKQMK